MNFVRFGNISTLLLLGTLLPLHDGSKCVHAVFMLDGFIVQSGKCSCSLSLLLPLQMQRQQQHASDVACNYLFGMCKIKVNTFACQFVEILGKSCQPTNESTDKRSGELQFWVHIFFALCQIPFF